MKYLTEKEIEKNGFEYARGLKEFEAKNGDSATLWVAEKDEIVANNYQAKEAGFYIYVIMCGAGMVEKLEAKNLVEACAAFNTVIQTIKA